MKKYRVILVLDGHTVETIIQAETQWKAWELARALYGRDAVQNVILIA
jgi:hypothetical protein